jgi:hypothetical protein
MLEDLTFPILPSIGGEFQHFQLSSTLYEIFSTKIERFYAVQSHFR